jgi:hypothetical protein
MSNRMSVLSRRLRRFVGGFSFATVALFSIVLYAAANAEPEGFGVEFSNLFVTKEDLVDVFCNKF